MFTDEEKIVLARRIRAWTDTLHRIDKVSYIWWLADYHVFGACDEPPRPPSEAWVDTIHARFEREVLKATGITISLPRVMTVVE